MFSYCYYRFFLCCFFILSTVYRWIKDYQYTVFLVVTNMLNHKYVTVLCELFRNRSRDPGPGASDVISDVIQLSVNNCREFSHITCTGNTGRNDVTRHHYHHRQQLQPQPQRTTGQSSAAVKRRMESSLSSSLSSSASTGIPRKRLRYEYNDAQRRLLSDAFAKSKSTKSTDHLRVRIFFGCFSDRFISNLLSKIRTYL